MRPLLVFVAVVALAAGIWIAVPDRTDEPPASPEQEPKLTAKPVAEPVPSRDATTADSGPGTVRGTVTRSGKPVAARVRLLRLREEDTERLAGGPSRLLAGTKTDAAGGFGFAGVSVGPREVVAVAADGAIGRAFVYPAATGIPTVVHIVIPGESLSFRVVAVYADGRPFDGEIALTGWTDAFVEKDASYECWRVDFETAGPDGSVVFTGLPPGVVRPLARIRGSLSVRGRPVRLPREGDYRFVVDRDLRWISGRVVADADGKPVGGASVRASGAREREPGEGILTGAETGRDGRFRIRVATDTYRLDARAEGFRPGHAKVEEGTDDVVVRMRRPPELPAPWTITGRVVRRDDGGPVAGAEVLATYASGSSMVPARGATDADGRYELTSRRAGDLLLFVLGGGWVSPLLARQGELSLEPLRIETDAGKSYERDLMAVPCASARVRVVGDGDAPLAGVAVSARLSGYAQKSTDIWRGLSRSVEARKAVTGEDGVATLGNLPPEGSVRFAARTESGLAVLHWQKMPASGEAAEITIRMPTAVTREVRFVFEDDRSPVAGATVRIWSVGKSEVNGFWMTDAEGRASLGPIPPGEAHARIHHPDVEYVHGGHLLPEGPGPSVVAVRRGLVFGGTVTFPDGSPAVGAYAVAEVYSDAEGERQFTVRADADGRFLLRRVPAGEVIHLIGGYYRDRQRWYARLEGARPGALDHVLRLEYKALKERPSELVVTVVGPDGKPVSGGTIRVWNNRGYAPPEATERGIYGPVSLSFGANAKDIRLEVFGAKSGGKLLAPKVVRPTELSGDLAIRLAVSGEIRGKVVDETGSPVPGVAVSALTADPAHPSPRSHPHGEAMSGPDGSFTIAGLANGPYDLAAQPTGGFTKPDPVRVPAGTAEARIILRPGVVPVLTLRDPKDRPVTRASLRLLPEGGRGPQVLYLPDRTTNPSGEIRLSGLDPAKRYHLAIWPRGEWLPVTLDPWEPKDTVIRFEPAYRITGAVESETGKVARARVYYRAKGADAWANVMAEDDGTFVIRRLAEGEYELAVTPAGGGNIPTPVIVRAGATSVTLTLR